MSSGHDATAERREASESASVFQVGDPVNDHFSLGLRTSLVGFEVAVDEDDSLGFSYERWQQGESDAIEGRTRPFADVINAIRARIRGNRS